MIDDGVHQLGVITPGNVAVWSVNNLLADGGGPPVPTGPQNANLVFAGPPTGAAAPPTFRALVPADVNGLSGAWFNSTFEVRNAGSPTNELLFQHDGTNGLIATKAGILRFGAGGVAEKLRLDLVGRLTINNLTSTLTGTGNALTSSTVVQLAGGLILQQGTMFVGAAPTVVLPLTFPNALMGCWANVAQSSAAGGASLLANAYPGSASSIGVSANTTAGYNMFWFAIGW